MKQKVFTGIQLSINSDVQYVSEIFVLESEYSDV